MLGKLSKPVKQSYYKALSTAVKFDGYGQPHAVLRFDTRQHKLVSDKIVSVKMLSAPINPSDINYVEGVYGVKSTFPSYAGGEGVGIVTEIGPNVKSVKPGDWVIPHSTSDLAGTWSTSVTSDESNWLPIQKDIPVHYAATLSVNPSTAYRLLKDFVDLKPGDVIIQNAANSMVGLAVIQLAREMGIKTINIVRSDRPQKDKTLELLTNLGGNINIDDLYLNSPGFQEILEDLPGIKLALNAVGGESVTDFARILPVNSTIVTYGGMSKKKISVPLETLAYKQIHMKAFWMYEWTRSHSKEERMEMIDELTSLIRQKKLTFFYEAHDFDDFRYALDKSMQPFSLRKVILNMDYPDRLLEHDAKSQDEYRVFEGPLI